MHANDLFGQLFIFTASGVAVTAITVAGTFLYKRRGSMHQLVADVKETKYALVGAPPTEINPNPPQGIIQRLDDYQAAMALRTDMGDKLIIAFTAQEKVVSEIKRTLTDVTTATVGNGTAIKDLQSQMAMAVKNAEVAAKAASKTAVATEANTKKNGGNSASVGDTASRTEEGLNDLVTRLEKSGVIEKKDGTA